MKKQCKQCGATLTGKRRVYCSRACTQLHYKATRRYLPDPSTMPADWKKKTAKANKDIQRRKALLQQCHDDPNLLTMMEVAAQIGIHYATAGIRAKNLGIEPAKKVHYSGWTGFYNASQLEKIRDYAAPDRNNPKVAERLAKNKKKVQARMAKPEVRARRGERARLYQAKKRLCPMYRMRQAVSTAVYDQLKRKYSAKTSPTWQALPYTPDELHQHLEKNFTEGMSWENYGDWHIDHIVPQAALPYDSYEHPNFRACWALSNLQPLWAHENSSKGSLHEGKRWSHHNNKSKLLTNEGKQC